MSDIFDIVKMSPKEHKELRDKILLAHLIDEFNTLQSVVQSRDLGRYGDKIVDIVVDYIEKLEADKAALKAKLFEYEQKELGLK